MELVEMQVVGLGKMRVAEYCGQEVALVQSKITELRQREVINIVDGKKLGTICDLEIDVEKGEITAIVVPGRSRFLRIFSRYEDVVIPWPQIRKIGIDVILVELGAFINHRVAGQDLRA